MIKILGVTIDHISADLRHVAEKAGAITIKIDGLLASKQAIVAAELIPEGEAVRDELIKLVDAANAGLQALVAVGDSDGVKGRLQRLGAQLTQAMHGDDSKGVTHYIHVFEAIIAALMGA